MHDSGEGSNSRDPRLVGQPARRRGGRGPSQRDATNKHQVPSSAARLPVPHHALRYGGRPRPPPINATPVSAAVKVVVRSGEPAHRAGSDSGRRRNAAVLDGPERVAVSGSSRGSGRGPGCRFLATRSARRRRARGRLRRGRDARPARSAGCPATGTPGAYGPGPGCRWRRVHRSNGRPVAGSGHRAEKF